ncbi:MAG: hypothetical protein NC392_00990 [Roseburia sp.]|nr:hypothetical protein [Roseburia sp.]
MISLRQVIKETYAILYWNIIAKNKPSRPKKIYDSDKQLNIILNGPSGKAYLEKLLDAPSIDKNIHYMVVNHFIIKWYELFQKLKPRYYVAIDPYYVTCTEWIDLIEAVTWKMTVIVNASYFYQFKNPNISLYFLAPIEIIRKSPILEILHMHNYCNVSLSNVSCSTILEGVRRGYGHIELYGLDLSDYMKLSVDKNNHLLNVAEHSYEDEEDTKIMDLYEYYPKIIDKWKVQIVNYNSYYLTEEYARKRKIRIFNMNPNSLVDAFEKRTYEE